MAETVWSLLDRWVDAGRIPGYVAALRIGDRTQARAGGRTAFGGPPMRQDTLFRIASITKPMGAVLALGLVEDGTLSLGDPVARWLPEAARPRVLRNLLGELDDTEPVEEPITVRHLLDGTSGWGAVMQDCPLQRAMMQRGVFGSPLPAQLSGEEFLARLCGLPLAFRPGTGWLYDSGMDLLGVLLQRATGTLLPELFAQRITGPLDMADTGFWAVDPTRLATAYIPTEGGLDVLDPPDGLYATPPPFAQLGGGLVSTAADVLRFYTAMADGGAPVISRASLELMTTDQLTPALRRGTEPFFGPGESWGLGTGVDIEAVQPWMAPGRWGWTGGTGTTAVVDPSRNLVAVLLTQRAMTGPDDGPEDFWTAAAKQADRPRPTGDWAS